MTATRSRTRETPAREEVRETATASHGRTRVRQSDDRFYIDPRIIPDGWSYQWNVVTVLGQEDLGQQAALSQLGFTPVPAERHAGLFMPVGYKGAIVIGGLRLDERPMELEMEARAEDRAAAVNQVRGSREQFGLKTGFDGPNNSNHPYAQRASFARSQFETVDAPAPKHQLAVD